MVPDFGAPTPDAGGSFDAPSFGGDLALPPAGAFTPALPEADQGLTATAPVVQERNAPISAPAIETVEDHKLLAMGILAACGAALLWSAQLPTPALRRLGGLDSGATTEPAPTASGAPTSEATAGLGRFARARSGSAPPL